MDQNQYRTMLNQEQEAQYAQWRNSLPENLQNDQDYDLRGAYLAGLKPSENNHLPDTFKQPNHPTFSNESMYSTEQTPGGTWSEDPNGKWTFNATQFNVDSFGKDNLINYFKEYEPDAILILPDQYQ